MSQILITSDDPETVKWFRLIVEPMFLIMQAKGIAEVHVKRVGNKVRFELIPEGK